MSPHVFESIKKSNNAVKRFAVIVVLLECAREKKHSQERKNLYCELDRARLPRRGKQAPQGRFCRTSQSGESELSANARSPTRSGVLFRRGGKSICEEHPGMCPCRSWCGADFTTRSRPGLTAHRDDGVAFRARHRPRRRDDAG